MNCRECEDLLVIAVYGKLNPSQEDQLRQHIGGCTRCARRVKMTTPYRDHNTSGDTVPQPNWERSWRIITESAFPTKKKNRSILPLYRFGLVAVTCLLIFTFGFLVGKKALWQKPSPPLSPEALWTEYTDQLEMIFINVINRSAQTQDEELTAFEMDVVSDILSRTRLLTHLLQQRGNDNFIRLLEEIEMILVSVQNLKPEDQDAKDQIDQIIRDGAHPDRLRHYALQNVKI